MKKINKNLFQTSLYSKASENGMVTLDKVSLSALTGIARRIITACNTGHGSPNARFAIFKMFRTHLLSMAKHHGPEHVVKYLKGCQLATQKCIAGTPVSSLKEILGEGVYPRLSSSGLPKVINTSDRKKILNGSRVVTRYGLTLFSLYRCIKIPGELKLQTITNSFSGDEKMTKEISQGISILAKHLVNIALITSQIGKGDLALIEKSSGGNKTSGTEIFTVLPALKAAGMGTPLGQLANITLNQRTVKLLALLDYMSRKLDMPNNPPIGWLSTKEEAAGKVRVFAMVDIGTQTVLRPIHDGIFAFLKALPNDGTHDQELSFSRALVKARQYGKSFGYDLSAATDRLPISIQADLISSLFGGTMGSSGSSLLVGRKYRLDLGKKGGIQDLTYSVGQPMGALSSGAMLALTHHLLVQYSYRRAYGLIVGNFQGFEGYELLGDDIVIFDEKVAVEYLAVMAALGVEINLSKSVVANREVVEFAKRTGLAGADVSALPWKSFIMNNSLLGRANLAYSLYRRLNVKHPFRYIKSGTSIEGKKESVNLTLLSILGMLANLNPELIIHTYRKACYNLKKLSKYDVLRMDSDKLGDLAVKAFNNESIRTKENPNEDRGVRIELTKPLTLFYPNVERDAMKGAQQMTVFILSRAGGIPFSQNQFFSNLYKRLPIYTFEFNDEGPEDIQFGHALGLFWYLYASERLPRHLVSAMGLSAMDKPFGDIFASLQDLGRYQEFLDIISRATEKEAGSKKAIRTPRPDALYLIKSYNKVNRLRPTWTFYS